MQSQNEITNLPGKITMLFKTAFLTALIITNNIYCQDSSAAISKKILSLNDCIKIAIDNNHKIKSSKEEISVANAQKKQAESAYWPQVSGKAIYTLTNNDLLFILPSFKMSVPPISLPGFSISLDNITVPQENVKLMDNENVHASVGLTYPIYTGGKVQSINKEAENGIEISKQEYKKSSLEVCFDVKRMFYGALAAKKIYKIGTDALERLDVTLELTESVYKNGSGKTTRLDYLKNKVTVDAVRTLVSQLKNDVKAAKDALVFTLGVNDDFDLPDEEIPFIPAGLNIDSLLNLAYNNNPDWMKVTSAVSAYQAKIDEAYSGYLPNVALIGSFDQNFNSYKYGIVNKENSSIWTIGLGVDIPIFNGFRTSAEVEENESELKKINEQKILLHDAICLQIKEVTDKLESTVETVNNARQAKLTAEENSSLTERAFQQDMAEAKDLVEAQIMESLMDVQYQKALYDNIEAAANLDLIIGNINTKNIK
ncbi:MAG: TolC family protein [Ignavibacteriaceae bacterium]